jgi:hypothetical protein
MTIPILDTDVAAHYLAAAGISAVRRTKKSDNNRISRATGASIVNDTADLKEEDVGTGCGLFEVRKIGDEYDFPSSLHLYYLNNMSSIHLDTTPSSNSARIPRLVRSFCVVQTRTS